MSAIGINHTTFTPLWSQGNAKAEVFMKPSGEAIEMARLESQPEQQELSKFLLNYGSTPHSTTKILPVQFFVS